MLFHFFHQYSKWTTVETGRLLGFCGETIGRYTRQTRECSVCGKVGVRKISS